MSEYYLLVFFNPSRFSIAVTNCCTWIEAKVTVVFLSMCNSLGFEKKKNKNKQRCMHSPKQTEVSQQWCHCVTIYWLWLGTAIPGSGTRRMLEIIWGVLDLAYLWELSFWSTTVSWSATPGWGTKSSAPQVFYSVRIMYLTQVWRLPGRTKVYVPLVLLLLWKGGKKNAKRNNTHLTELHLSYCCIPHNRRFKDVNPKLKIKMPSMVLF